MELWGSWVFDVGPSFSRYRWIVTRLGVVFQTTSCSTCLGVRSPPLSSPLFYHSPSLVDEFIFSEVAQLQVGVFSSDQKHMGKKFLPEGLPFPLWMITWIRKFPTPIVGGSRRETSNIRDALRSPAQRWRKLQIKLGRFITRASLLKHNKIWRS